MIRESHIKTSKVFYTWKNQEMQVLIDSRLDDNQNVEIPFFVLTRGKTIGEFKIVIRNDCSMLRNNLTLVYYISLLRNVCNLHNGCDLKYFFLSTTFMLFFSLGSLCRVLIKIFRSAFLVSNIEQLNINGLSQPSSSS